MTDVGPAVRVDELRHDLQLDNLGTTGSHGLVISQLWARDTSQPHQETGRVGMDVPLGR